MSDVKLFQVVSQHFFFSKSTFCQTQLCVYLIPKFIVKVKRIVQFGCKRLVIGKESGKAVYAVLHVCQGMLFKPAVNGSPGIFPGRESFVDLLNDKF